MFLLMQNWQLPPGAVFPGRLHLAHAQPRQLERHQHPRLAHRPAVVRAQHYS